MDFGQLAKSRPFDASLAPIHPGSETLLAREPKRAREDVAISIGAPQWNLPDCSKSLADYVRIWKSIELNTSFYRTPEPEDAKAWADATPDDFRFHVKVHRDLSHEYALWKDPRPIAPRMEHFNRGWQGLGEKWAGSFLQLPPGLGIDHADDLAAWLDLWKGPPLFVEFRHRSWFENRQLKREPARILAERGVGTVIADTPGERSASHGTLTTPDLFVRGLGQTAEGDAAIFETDLARIDAWAERIDELATFGLRSANLFLHTPELTRLPELTLRLSESLTDRGFRPRLGPGKPESLPSQLSLF
jgi:uncharacterized protein YecE (DUF72 family)